MNAYSLEQVVDFRMRIFKNKVAQCDNIFLDKAKENWISVYPIKNRL
jgi:hypothetical protein